MTEEKKVLVLDDSDLALRKDRVLVDIFSIIRSVFFRIPEMLIPAFAVAIAAMLAFSAVVRPKYTSTTKINVLPMNTPASYSLNAQLLTPMMTNCVSVIKSRYLAERAIAYFDRDESYESFQDKLSVSTIANTSILSISFTDSDPGMARKIVSFIRAASVREIANIVGFTSISVVEEASYPTSPDSSPLVIGFLGGAAAGFISFLVVVALTIKRDTSAATKRDREVKKRREKEKEEARE